MLSSDTFVIEVGMRSANRSREVQSRLFSVERIRETIAERRAIAIPTSIRSGMSPSVHRADVLAVDCFWRPLGSGGCAGYQMSKINQDNLLLARSFNFKVDSDYGREALFHARETVGQGIGSSHWLYLMTASRWGSVLGHCRHHQLTECPDMRQFVAAFALKQEDFLMAEEHAQIAHGEFAFTGAGAR